MAGIVFTWAFEAEGYDEEAGYDKTERSETAGQGRGGDRGRAATSCKYCKILSAPTPGSRHLPCLPAVWETSGAKRRAEGEEVLFG